MRKYHVATSGYIGYTTMTESELKQYVKEETARARRYFGTAVCHTAKGEMFGGSIYYTITARKDEGSALWLNITAHMH